MQEKKNIRSLITLVTLLLLTVIVYSISQNSHKTITDPDIFQVKDYNTIDRIVLESPADTISIGFDGTRWRINERYQADRQMVDLLFATLQQVKPRRPVAAAISDSIASRLKAAGVRVSIYTGNDLQKIFFAGGDSHKTQAYFMDPETAGVYVVGIPGYRVYASGIFELDKNEWRDKYVFAFNWRNFERMEVTFPGKPAENFAVAMHENFFGIEGISQTDTSRLNTFLDDVSLLTVAKYLNDSQISTDSLLREKAQMHIRVKDIGKREYSLAIYAEKRGRDQVPGLVNETQVALFNQRSIRNILKPKSYFLLK